MEKYKTEQESFWRGDFGKGYIERNKSNDRIPSTISLFSKILHKTRGVESIIEFGSNIGRNIQAIKTIMPYVNLSAIEINKEAAEHLKKIENLTVYNQSILDFIPPVKYDFAFTKGVMIHINPDELTSVYEKLYNSSARYICVAEYYNPTPVEIPYRGHNGKLFKRDFAGEMLELYPNLELVDYGFVYRNDPMFDLGDLTWFLMEKRG